MSPVSKYESKIQKIALSCDAFSTGYLTLCLLFLAPYLYKAGPVAYWFIPTALLVPFVLMPVIYTLMHRYPSLLFGRYHLAMPVSAILSALFLVIMFSAGGIGRGSAALIFFGALVFVCSLSIYRYCSFSVWARLTGETSGSVTVQYEIFCALGAVIAVGAFCLFSYYDVGDAYLNTAYVIGGAGIVIAMFQYLTTYYDIPRLGGRRNVTVKSSFRMLFGDIERKTFFSSLLFECAFAALAVLVMVLAFCWDLTFITVVAVVLIIEYGGAKYIGARVVRRRTFALSVVNFACAIIAAALCIGTLFLGEFKTASLIMLGAAAAFIGVGGALSMRQAKIRFLTIKPLMTSGILFILLELTMFAAFAVAMYVTAVVMTVATLIYSYAFLIGLGVCVLFAAIALALAGRAGRVSRGSKSYAARSHTVSPETVDDRDTDRAQDGETSDATDGDATRA